MKLKAAIIDLYDNEPNEGMRCIQDLLKEADHKFNHTNLDYKIYETRSKIEIPDDNYDIYISSGGPGSPFEGLGSKWEKEYFNLLDKIWTNNQNKNNRKKYVFFICHSFQMMVRYFELGKVVERESRSFGIVPVFKTDEGEREQILNNLNNPFLAADFRNWQAVQPNKDRFDELGAKLLCIEDHHAHDASLERAMMAIKVSDEFFATQFHPEADPASMHYHFKQPKKQKEVIEEYGEEKLKIMLERLETPDNISLTRNTVIPNFLNKAINELSLVEVNS
jgi:GMP synthase-like glutamine amidotransferase